MIEKIIRKLLYFFGIHKRAEIEISIKGFTEFIEYCHKNDIAVGDTISVYGADNSGSFRFKIIKESNESNK